MADAPWRCSQCGTVNEPVANACRTCGRWPSLFDLEASTIEAETAVAYDDLDEHAAHNVDIEYAEPEVYEPNGSGTAGRMPEQLEEAYELEEIEGEEEPKPIWQRLASFIVPIGIVLYIVISALVNNDAG